MTAQMAQLRRYFWLLGAAAMAGCSDGTIPIPVDPGGGDPGGGGPPPITASCTATPQPVQRTGGTVTGASFSSTILGGSRELRIYVPPGYNASASACYPVLYMQDGEMIFVSGNAAGTVTWGMDTAATGLISRGQMAPVIIVGIVPGDRNSEYTPDHPAGMVGNYGNGANYVRMVIQEVKPFVDARYRTRSDAQATGIGGSSLGGLIAFWAGIHNPGTFGRVAALSATLSWSNSIITRDVSALSAKVPVRVWFDRGTEEIDGGTPRSSVDDLLLQTMVSKGWVDGTDVRYFLQTGAAHSELWWARRVDLFLPFLFPQGT